MAYTTINKSSLHMNTKLYTGNSTDNRSITGLEFQPDWVWIKERGASNSHSLFDAVRGANKQIQSNANAAQYDFSGDANQELKSFTSDGFTLGTGGGVNNNSDTYVAWNWKAGTGQGSSNTDGSINTTYTSVNTTAGFSISQYTGTGSVGTIGHDLGAVPKMIITKPYSTTGQWYTYHASLGNTHYLDLVSTAAASDDAEMWNDTSPTSSVFTVGVNGNTNGSGKTTIAYAFAEKTGYSKFGSYVGNGNGDGPFIYTGFKPAFVMIKNASASSTDWFMYDKARGGPVAGYYGNNNKYFLRANTNGAEANENFDMLSNGFKIRITNNFLNGSGNELIYMAFAEAPLVGSNNVPCTAR